jgi:predicted nucleic acid-binding protein
LKEWFFLGSFCANSPISRRRRLFSAGLPLLQLGSKVVETQGVDRAAGLHQGEAAAIALAVSLHADLLLMDERKGVKVARAKRFCVTGTLGLVEMAARRGLVDFAEAAERLRQTTFRSPEALLDLMLKRNSKNVGKA